MCLDEDEEEDVDGILGCWNMSLLGLMPPPRRRLLLPLLIRSPSIAPISTP